VRDFGVIVIANLASFIGGEDFECLWLVWIGGLRLRGKGQTELALLREPIVALLMKPHFNDSRWGLACSFGIELRMLQHSIDE